jgi:hypothetical protein
MFTRFRVQTAPSASYGDYRNLYLLGDDLNHYDDCDGGTMKCPTKAIKTARLEPE